MDVMFQGQLPTGSSLSVLPLSSLKVKLQGSPHWEEVASTRGKGQDHGEVLVLVLTPPATELVPTAGAIGLLNLEKAQLLFA